MLTDTEKELLDILREAALQIDYLDNDHDHGTTVVVLMRIQAIIAKYEDL